MDTAVVTGASSGIGLEFVRQLAAAGLRVIAASRRALDAPELRALQETHGCDRLLIRSLDVADAASREEFFARLSRDVDAVDWLVNCAGIVSADERTRTTFSSLDQQELSRTFLVNSIAPLMMARGAYPLLRLGRRPRIVNLSSDNGSLARRSVGGKYSYCASKAALNMMTRILAADLRADGILVVSFHPGWVKTRMTRGEPAPLEPEESVRGMLGVLETLDIEGTGAFLDWKGRQVPW